MAITTYTEVKTFLDLESSITKFDTLFTKLIANAQNLIEEYCNRKFESSEVTEYFDGDRYLINLSRPPVDTSKTIKVYDDPDRKFTSDTLLDSDDYAVYDDKGIIKFDYKLSPGIRSVKVIYTGGYSTIPGGVVQACWEIVAKLWKEGTQRELNIATRETPSGTVSFIRQALAPSTLWELDRYRI
jgi:hypothetical protein